MLLFVLSISPRIMSCKGEATPLSEKSAKESWHFVLRVRLIFFLIVGAAALQALAVPRRADDNELPGNYSEAISMRFLCLVIKTL